MAQKVHLSLLKQHPRKMSLVMKRKFCGWNWKFLLQVAGEKGRSCALVVGVGPLNSTARREPRPPEGVGGSAGASPSRGG